MSIIELLTRPKREPTELDVAAARGQAALRRIIAISHTITDHAREAHADGRVNVSRAQLILASTYLEDALRNLESILSRRGRA